MKVLEAIQERSNVRSYLATPVPEDALERILEAARLAPSAGNVQSWRFVIVTDADRRKALSLAAGRQKHVAEAPVVIVAAAVTDGHVMCCGQPAYTMDVAIALEHIALQATAEGLATCWVGAFSEDAARKVIGAPGPPEVRIVQMMTLGYSAVAPKPKDRKPLSEIVMREQWVER